LRRLADLRLSEFTGRAHSFPEYGQSRPPAYSNPPGPVAASPSKFYHDLSADADGRVDVCLIIAAFNGGQGLCLTLRYAKIILFSLN
jgi:hypothetical protein